MSCLIDLSPRGSGKCVGPRFACLQTKRCALLRSVCYPCQLLANCRGLLTVPLSHFDALAPGASFQPSSSALVGVIDASNPFVQSALGALRSERNPCSYAAEQFRPWPPSTPAPGSPCSAWAGCASRFRCALSPRGSGYRLWGLVPTLDRDFIHSRGECSPVLFRRLASPRRLNSSAAFGSTPQAASGHRYISTTGRVGRSRSERNPAQLLTSRNVTASERSVAWLSHQAHQYHESRPDAKLPLRVFILAAPREILVVPRMTTRGGGGTWSVPNPDIRSFRAVCQLLRVSRFSGRLRDRKSVV